jgi:DNA primase
MNSRCAAAHRRRAPPCAEETEVDYRIDFRRVKERASFAAVLRRYRLVGQTGRTQHFILCPFHREADPSCRIDHARNRFRCFGCGAKGSILDFVASLEGCTIKEAATIIAASCDIATDCSNRGAAAAGRHPTGAYGERPTRVPARNKPLRISLNLDPTHLYLLRRGLTPELIERFGLGYCNQGLMRGRIAIPLHDEEGQLVAYAGRWAAEGIPEGRPRYLLPRGFQKQLVLFNLHRVKGERSLTIVESYWSVFRLTSLAVPAVALMGRELSIRHIELLAGAGVDHVQLMLDGDAPGRLATAKMLPELAPHFCVRDLELPDSMKPHSAPEDVLRRLIGIP